MVARGFMKIGRRGSSTGRGDSWRARLAMCSIDISATRFRSPSALGIRYSSFSSDQVVSNCWGGGAGGG